MGFGHTASFNEFRSSLPPIQEEMEAGDHLAYTADLLVPFHIHLDLLLRQLPGSQMCQLSKMWTRNWTHHQLLQSVTQKQLEAEVAEVCKVDQNMSTDEKIDQPKSSIDCLVDGHATPGELLDMTLAQSSIETRDNSGTGPVTSGQENPYDMHGNVNLACKSLLLIGNGSGSEAEKEAAYTVG
ncbi:uncharacterized protein [Solanum lycopersicum]|uniref:uncharacterized protein n=1 Tax=Solanum lycopersicum TaxID=4081 RepID=UPI00374820E3